MRDDDYNEGQLPAFIAGVVLTIIGVFVLVLIGAFLYFTAAILWRAIA